MEKNAKSVFIATVFVGKKSENNERDVTNIGYITFFIMGFSQFKSRQRLKYKTTRYAGGY
ncbi:hypothetical protein GWJ01_04650 [Proteus sp. G2618]|uniref:hypothetical protein n=1 Tax=Proteus sp. G2618 TaxID=2698841 RepID=UPI0013779BAB|nr:hypothetical protein [Proteus sp. G2618]NBN70394.1 hypothetical protein [Proteus sp. G2618]